MQSSITRLYLDLLHEGLMPAAEFYISSTKYSLQERMTRRGKVYDVVFRIVTLDGIEKQKKLSGFSSKTLAKQGYTDFVTSKCELVKNNPIKKKDPTKQDLLVGDLIREYLASLSNQNKTSSIYGKQKIFKKFVLPYFENTKIKELTKETLYRWQDDLWNTRNPRTKSFYSYKYLSNVRAFFRTFLGWCESRYGIKNSFSEVDKPKRRAQKTKMQIWTREDFEKFIATVDDPTYHALFTLLFYTGRRKGEIFALHPDDIKSDCIVFDKSLTRKTFNGGSYEITSTKAEKEQAVPVCASVQNELKNYTGGTPFFFGGERPLADNTVRRVFRSYCDKAGIPPIRIHDLRHSFVSMLIHLGANFMVIADLIGDTVEQITKTYGHLYEGDKRAILAKL